MRVIPRAEWGARYGDGFGPAPLPARELWLHHSVTSAPPVTATFEQDAVAVRALEAIGQSRFGGGISYTFVVAPSGRAFVGHSVGRQGAHTGGRNSIARAICLIGNYETAIPSGAMLATVGELVAVGAAAGWWDRPALDGGHRDAPGASTACPGRHAYALIPDINRRALAPEEDDVNLSDRLPDLYTNKPDDSMTVGDTMAWGTAHAARAFDEAKAVRADLSALRADVAALADTVEDLQVGGIDYARLADMVADRLAERMAS